MIIAKAQARIDKAAAKGKDVTALQAALNAFASALKSAKPIYDSTERHCQFTYQGFDASGKVTDAGTGQSNSAGIPREDGWSSSLQWAGQVKPYVKNVKAFRDANKPAGVPEQGT